MNKGLYYKILLDDTIVGGINLFDNGGEHFSLGAIFIDPQFHNQGIGSMAIKFIEEKHSQVKKWTLDTPSLNINNHRFYERHGYIKVGEIQPQKDVEFYLSIFEKLID